MLIAQTVPFSFKVVRVHTTEVEIMDFPYVFAIFQDLLTSFVVAGNYVLLVLTKIIWVRSVELRELLEFCVCFNAGTEELDYILQLCHLI